MFNVFPILTWVFLGAIIILLAVFGPGIRHVGARGMVTVALLVALSSAGGAALQSIPGLQPSSFIVMMCGITLGPGAGLLCGVGNAFISRLLGGGLGPWAVWQALLWGLMGLLAGLTRKLPFRAQAAVGFAWGFVFGWIMNLQFYSMGMAFVWPGYLAACAGSFVPDLTHAVTNFVLMLCLGKGVGAIYERMGGKTYDHARKRPGDLPRD